jgi:hypothetical protein
MKSLLGLSTFADRAVQSMVLTAADIAHAVRTPPTH